MTKTRIRILAGATVAWLALLLATSLVPGGAEASHRITSKDGVLVCASDAGLCETLVGAYDCVYDARRDGCERPLPGPP
ncbi:MAG TPA: hypothetical protein VM681_11125 [Candidatus Thermoplasmatota archaeon]|nr:hypothetical protein [Candidatus Thermoplasmatota archaeon]